MLTTLRTSWKTQLYLLSYNRKMDGKRELWLVTNKGDYFTFIAKNLNITLNVNEKN